MRDNERTIAEYFKLLPTLSVLLSLAFGASWLVIVAAFCSMTSPTRVLRLAIGDELFARTVVGVNVETSAFKASTTDEDSKIKGVELSAAFDAMFEASTTIGEDGV
jgi:hypothetical protein